MCPTGKSESYLNFMKDWVRRGDKGACVVLSCGRRRGAQLATLANVGKLVPMLIVLGILGGILGFYNAVAQVWRRPPRTHGEGWSRAPLRRRIAATPSRMTRSRSSQPRLPARRCAPVRPC